MNPEIHRLLDEAFAGIEMTPDAQDLKEELRLNLADRAAELEAAGLAPAPAARQAVEELGDVRALMAEDAGASPHSSPYAAYAGKRVRPAPGFVVRVVVWSIAAVVGITIGILAATGVLPIAVGGQISLFSIAATGLGLLVGDVLAQETTTNHPMPERRAAGYALATFLAAFGASFAGLVALGSLAGWAIVFAALGIIAAIILFAFLGASQTNRHKAWVRQLQAQHPANRFEEEPETAARFGMYTAAIWLVTFAVIALLIFTVDWWWALLAFVGGLAVMMLVLARMMFGPRPPRH